MIAFNLGQAKTGSTFVHMVLNWLRNQTGTEQDETYFPRIPQETADRLAALDAPGRVIVAKSHSPLTPEIRSGLDRPGARLFATFRDPRDSGLAQLSAGERDRAAGTESVFTRYFTGADLIAPLEHQMTLIRTVLDDDHPAIVRIPYFALATDQDGIVRRICAELGLERFADKAVQVWQRRRDQVGQFNKGIANRFVADMALADLRLLQDRFADDVAYIDARTRETLAGSPLLDEFETACAERDARIAERLSDGT